MAFRGIQSTNIISTEVGFTDPVLVLNKDGSTSVDVGFLGKIGSTSYAGLVKDSTTEDFLLIKSISINSSSVNDIDATDLSLVKGDLVVDTVTGDLIGDVTGQVSDISNFNTDSLSEGSTNLYYTTTRADADFDTRIATKNTDNLSEGSTNLYYTQARVDARAQLKFDELVGAAPSALNTLDELAAALGDDANFSTTVTNSIAAKLPLAGGTMTGNITVDYSNLYLVGIKIRNNYSSTQSDWNLGAAGGTSGWGATNGNFIIRDDTTNSTGIEIEQGAGSNTAALHIDSSSNVGIGTSTPSSTLHVVGSILATADITAYSDDSLKTNVQVIDDAVSKVEQLRGVTFDRIEDGSTSTGVIAQELKEVLPEAVHTDEQGVHSVAYGNVVGLLIEAIKEQQKQIDELIKANKS
jgi:hypothetical protein